MTCPLEKTLLLEVDSTIISHASVQNRKEADTYIPPCILHKHVFGTEKWLHSNQK